MARRVPDFEIYGLIGYPVSHSLSPKLHNSYLERNRIKGVYLADEVEPRELEQMVKEMRSLQINGVNVTSPYKEDVVHYLDKLEGDALFLKSVNTIKRVDHHLIGYNTDTLGVQELLRIHGIDVRDKSAAVLGSGGAAKSTVLALLRMGARQVTVFSRSPHKREPLLALFENHPVDGRALHTFETYAEGMDLLINATPVGMGHLEGQSPVSIKGLKTGAAVVDLIYKPEKTALLYEASSLGHTIANGLSMLVGQAAASMAIWRETEVTTMNYLEFL